MLEKSTDLELCCSVPFKQWGIYVYKSIKSFTARDESGDKEKCESI